MNPLSRFGSTLLIAGLLLTPAAVAQAPTTSPSPTTAQAPLEDPRLTHGRDILKLLYQNQFDKFTNQGDETMRSKFTPDRALMTWVQLTANLGKFKAERSAAIASAGEMATVSFVWDFENGTAFGRLVLDKGDRMAGLWFDKLERNYPPPPYVDKNAFREEPVTVSAGRFPLAGTLTLPSGAGPFPGVVLVHGSGPQDQDETVGGAKPFRDLAWGLAGKGVAVLRYEKRTRAHPNATQPADWTLDLETNQDALAAVESLRKHSGIDPKRVFILGHSIGGMAAPYLAQRDSKLAGIIVMAGAARNVLDLLIDQSEYLAKLDGTISPEEKKAIDELRPLLQKIRDGQAAATTQPVLMQPAVYWERLSKVQPAQTAATLSVPILVLQGGRDYQVTKADFAIWREQLGNSKNATLRLYDDLNHLFFTGEGPSGPKEYERGGFVDIRVIEDIAGWVKTGVVPTSQPASQPAAK